MLIYTLETELLKTLNFKMWTKYIGKIFVVSQVSRVRCLCPKCNVPIILDYSTFLDNPVDITCYRCKSSFYVLSVSTRKTKLELHLNETAYGD